MSPEESLREGAGSSASSPGRDLSLGKGPRALIRQGPFGEYFVSPSSSKLCLPFGSPMSAVLQAGQVDAWA
ncbi:unnamed protein product [Prunus armeniaca]